MNKLYLLVGPSGSGKTTVANWLEKEYNLRQVNSYTTRPPRFFNEPGHIFLTDEEFDKLEGLVAYTEYNGFRYGATKKLLDKSDIYVIDPSGVKTLRQNYDNFEIIWLSATVATCRSRMRSRGSSEEEIEKRLNNDRKEFSGSVYVKTIMFGGKTIYTDDLSIEEVCHKVWDHILSTEMAEYGLD